ncbi:MAG: peptidyl-Lys metalloendopeptidase [Acidobacteriota bacterium]|jgi:peptidyl-Lys metalloendopeptidase|nr:peptidyl-Lys metalloendopeptidase [Acidobacteriota bacterium]
MLHVRGMRLWLLVVLAVFCGVMSASSASAGMQGGLSAAIETDKAFLSGAESAVVRVTLRNDSAEDRYVPYWQTALRGVHGNLFDVRLNGKPVAYVGRVHKWGKPQAEDYVRIPANSSLTAEVDLSRYYDLSHTGEHSLRYLVPVQDSLRGMGTDIAFVLGMRDLESNTLYVAVERDGRGRFVQELSQNAGQSVTPGYVSCTSTRQTSLLTALGNAETISLKARDYLNNLPSASRPTDTAYRTWFGAYDSSRYSTVQSHYVSINSAFSTKKVDFYCDCTDSSYAYVYTNQPYKIHLCNAFWNAPTLGIDSKAGTLVHEMSHFTVTAGTSDYAYGTSACQSLANKKPARAINNADSHEYFAETR